MAHEPTTTAASGAAFPKRRAKMTKPSGRKPMRIGAVLLKEVPYKNEWPIDLTWRGDPEIPSGRGHKRLHNWRHAEEFAARVNKRLDDLREKGAGRYKYNDVLDDFLKKCEQLSQAKNRGMSPDTLDIYERIIENHLRPKFGGKRVEAITGQEVEDWVIEASQSGKFQTVRGRLRLFKNTLRHAVRRKMISAFPADVDAVRVPGKFTKRANVPDASDIEELRKYIHGQRPVKYSRMKWSCQKVMMVLVISCGMRAGEIAALQWDSIDRETGEIEVKETLGRLAGRKGPKSDSYRKIPTTPAEQQIIDEHAELYKEKYGKCVGPVLMPRDGRPSAHTISKWFSQAIKDAKLIDPKTKKRKFTTHGGRHWFISHATKATGGDIHQVSKWAGHKKASTTLDVYGHLIDDPEARRKFKRMPNWLVPVVEKIDTSPEHPMSIAEMPRSLPAPAKTKEEVIAVEPEIERVKPEPRIHIPDIAEPWVRPFVDMLADGTPIAEAYDWLAKQLEDRASNDPTKRITLATAWGRATDEFRRLKLPSPKSFAARMRTEKIIKLHREGHQALDIARMVNCHKSRVYQILRDRGHNENANNPLGYKVNLGSNFGRQPQPQHNKQLKLL